MIIIWSSSYLSKWPRASFSAFWPTIASPGSLLVNTMNTEAGLIGSPSMVLVNSLVTMHPHISDRGITRASLAISQVRCVCILGPRSQRLVLVSLVMCSFIDGTFTVLHLVFGGLKEFAPGAITVDLIIAVSPVALLSPGISPLDQSCL